MTLLNQHRARDLAALPSAGGDPSLRVELLRLAQSAPDFAAGFDRVASTPEPSKNGFTTDFVLDLEWRGGQKLVPVRVYATQKDGAWHLAGFGVAVPE